jgi:serine/threonine-protein kinase
VRHVRVGLTEPSGLTGVMGAGVQGLGEAPWLDLDTPAETNGWWARSATQPSALPYDTDPPRVSQFNGAGHEDSHTLVVDREDGGYADRGRHQVGREPFLGRWLFGPRLLIVVLVVALGLGLGLGGWWLFSGRFAHVPSVAQDSVSQATAILTADGFHVRQGAQVHSNTIPKGKVVATSPAGRVSKGATISLLISSGPFTSVVPDVHNDTQSAAQAALTHVHLVSTIQKVGSNAPLGTVVGTNPPAGTTWPQTKTVTILVAAGPPLPDFTGQSIDAARQWASQNNVKLQEQPDDNSQYPAGTVVSQQPTAGATFQPGQTVVVQVSTGPQLVPVPAVIGMDVLQATQVLRQAGFQVKVNKFGFTNKVWDYSPVGEAPAGSTITLEVGPF